MYSSKQTTLYCQDYFSSPLTIMQQFMLKGEGSAMYRKPYLYRLASHIQMDEFNKMLYDAISSNMLMQVRVCTTKSKTGQAFQQFQPLPSIDKWIIEHEEILIPPNEHIEKVERPIPLLKGYPWRIKYLTYNNERYLYVEFHQICMDEFGVKSFENSLFRTINRSSCSLSGHLSSMKLATNMETLARQYSSFTLRVIHLLKREYKLPVMETKKLEYELTQAELSQIHDLASQYEIDVQVVYQLLMEHALGNEFEGQAYGMLDNLRSTVGNYDEAGCFTYMVKQHIQGLRAMRSRLYTLHMQRNERKQGEVVLQPVQDTVQIVFSFEEVLCKYLQEVDITEHSSYPLTIKVKRSSEYTKLCLQYQEAFYDEKQCSDIVERFKHSILLLYRQLCFDHAS